MTKYDEVIEERSKTRLKYDIQHNESGATMVHLSVSHNDGLFIRSGQESVEIEKEYLPLVVQWIKENF